MTSPPDTEDGTERRPTLSRRGVLALAAVSVSAVWTVTASTAGARTKARPNRAAAATTAPPTPQSPPQRPPQSLPPSLPPSTSPPVQAKPVFTLADYRAAVPGPGFPPNAVALTIDDGPHPVWTPKVLALLDRYHVPATFCLIGNQVRGHESVARSVVGAGHHVANHSYSHPAGMAKSAPDQMREEIHRAQDKIYSATGYAPRLFRGPGGAWSPDLMAQSAQAGMLFVDWSNDPKDWQQPGTATVTERMLAAQPGQILLCHDGGGDRSQTYAALQTVIPTLQARGYTFVAL